MADKFAEAMRLMRKHDPQLQEDGFALLKENAVAHLPRLIDTFAAESEIGLRRWLLELIASTGDDQALPVLVEALRSDDESLHYWAVDGLERIDSKESRIAVRRHRGEPIS